MASQSETSGVADAQSANAEVGGQGQLYSFPQTSAQLIEHNKLIPHPEGGYYAVTWSMDEEVPSPFATAQAARNMATCIYYFLCAPTPGLPMLEKEGKPWRSEKAVFHLNKSSTMHVHHAGRSQYTLISAQPPLGPGLKDEQGRPLTRIVVMGEDITKGEVRQLMVPGGWWKVSEIPPQDLEAVKSGQVDPARVGAYISEVVVPGFHWEDHTFITKDVLSKLFIEKDQAEFIEKYSQYVMDE